MQHLPGRLPHLQLLLSLHSLPGSLRHVGGLLHPVLETDAGLPVLHPAHRLPGLQQWLLPGHWPVPPLQESARWLRVLQLVYSVPQVPGRLLPDCRQSMSEVRGLYERLLGLRVCL